VKDHTEQGIRIHDGRKLCIVCVPQHTSKPPNRGEAPFAVRNEVRAGQIGVFFKESSACRAHQRCDGEIFRQEPRFGS
jgi:hypothetical protein